MIPFGQIFPTMVFDGIFLQIKDKNSSTHRYDGKQPFHLCGPVLTFMGTLYGFSILQGLEMAI